MSKYCGKCSLQMQEDDFLCPRCGAIWGDRIYRVPVTLDPEEPDTEVQEVSIEEQPAHKNRLRRLLPIAAACFGLALLLCLTYFDRDMWAGEGGSMPSTSATNTTLPQPTTTAPPATESEYVKYTVKVIDQYGNPVPNVTLSYPNTNPFLSTHTVIVKTDSNGTVTFELRRSWQSYVSIVDAPDGYTSSLLNSTYFFNDGATDLVIILQFADEYPLPSSYSVTVNDPQWLYEELNDSYAAGVAVDVKIPCFDGNQEFMLFIDGEEVPYYTVVDGNYRQYTFLMPNHDVIIDIKTYDLDMPHPNCEVLIKAYYRQIPGAEDVSLMHYYGTYGDSIVGMLKTGSLDASRCEEECLEYRFLYQNLNTILVLVGDAFYNIRQAYILGYLTEEDIGEIHRLHMEYFPELYMDVEPN